MKRIVRTLDDFFFAPISATGFGMMRMMWALVVFCSSITLWPDVWRYFSNAGLLPPNLQPLMLRTFDHFTIFSYITSPSSVFTIYLVYLGLLIMMFLGVRTRFVTIVTVLLMFSFHERNYMILAGGETVLRTLGFLLMIAPGTVAFSLDRGYAQWESWKKTQTLLPALRMSIWPYRLLVWQLIVLYIASAWDKVLGEMWWAGTATASALHHPTFARGPLWLMDLVSVFSVPLSRLVVIYEFCWLLLLVPPVILVGILGLKPGGVKRALITAGVAFHGSIFLLMRVGTFPFAFFASYLGLLKDEDFASFRAYWNRNFKGRAYVFYDSGCGFCTRTAVWMKLCDWLGRLELIDFHNDSEKQRTAPDIPMESLDTSMHIRITKTLRNPVLGRMEKGFDAFRALCWHLPPFWILAPFLYIPGVTQIGRLVYQRIADNRKNCDGESCRI